MNLENKKIKIERSSINSLNREILVLVNIYEELNAGVKSLYRTYELKIEGDFNGHDDPAMLSAIIDILSEID